MRIFKTQIYPDFEIEVFLDWSLLIWKRIFPNGTTSLDHSTFDRNTFDSTMLDRFVMYQQWLGDPGSFEGLFLRTFRTKSWELNYLRIIFFWDLEFIQDWFDGVVRCVHFGSFTSNAL